MIEQTRQLEIFHLSDIHFGPKHRFVPPLTADGDRGAAEGYPRLIEKLREEFFDEDPGCPTIVCITGDLTTAATYDEFEEAESLVKALADSMINGRKQSMSSVFVVPGNHDVDYTGNDVGSRWQRWMEFHNRLYGTSHPRENPWACAKVYNLSSDLGIVVLCLNSSIYVQKGMPSERRGEVDLKQLSNLKAQLEAIPAEDLESAIRIALIHHHPVLVPSLVEADRGYDAVVNSDKLLSILHRFGFHLLLHGHKHYPLTFLERVNSAFLDVDDQPIMVVAGGSAGSKELPEHPKRTNCYNRITVKWHPKAGQARIRVVTRGLELYEGDEERLATDWRWRKLKEEDRSFYKGRPIPTPRLHAIKVNRLNDVPSRHEEGARIAEYQRTRGNMPVVEVMPSLKPNQAYEARLWIVPHNRSAKDIPLEVTWSAGRRFPAQTISAADDESFCGLFNYWGPMLVQAHMTFSEGPAATAHVYARMPADYSQRRSE